MNLFDPLGIVACFTIHGKILIQSVWRSGVQWDDPICDEEYGMWQRWIRLAPNLDKVKIPRCYFQGYRPSSYESLQLHVFVDAIELAYCAVAYFRILDDDIPRCALVAAKTKVTPLRPQSIPRNELCSAVLGSRLMKSIVEYHSLKICRKFLWTDSLTVMAWLRADPRKYRQFVGFRVAEILSLTAVDDWYWVPSNLNIADQGTKWGDGPSFEPDRLWYNGPEFLLLPSEEWPKRKQPSEAPADELRTVYVHRLKTEYCRTYIIIVPKDHPATNLLILRYHQKYGHANTETVLNELKQQYYIPRMRATVKKAIKSCMWCRVYRAKPCTPKMAPLPQPRVKPYVRPFTFTGLDYFGPLLVKRGRCNEKSCKMAIRRFIAKHGPPQELYCDNGTNFRGASRELAEEA
ncbi:uncharacterized protein LOC129752315 [Uranotaenia lowii]|uniref:uncharacterized protein LOC129752315 n=1 Tax=Uranotaenia lowii TaxID=190385 RepID=UPI002479A56D|nr:uncharacterized protein LOC129752315 [Uranotaenia lowii]